VRGRGEPEFKGWWDVPADVSLTGERRDRGRREICRSCGAALVFLVGPAAGACAWWLLGMGAMEASALVFLISGWLGPRLLGFGGS
jgi:hypothetical protein